MKRSDRELGMDRDITRRDFVSGVGVAITGSALAGPSTAAGSARRSATMSSGVGTSVRVPDAVRLVSPARSATHPRQQAQLLVQHAGLLIHEGVRKGGGGGEAEHGQRCQQPHEAAPGVGGGHGDASPCCRASRRTPVGSTSLSRATKVNPVMAASPPMRTIPPMTSVLLFCPNPSRT